MSAETFFTKFDRLIEAPNAVAKMRELILELAIQGKLVEQDPDDGDGFQLLAQIREKNKARKLAEEPTDAPIDVGALPRSWAQTCLGNVSEIVRGVSFPGEVKSNEKREGLVACLRTASVQAEIDWSDLIFIPETFVGRAEQWLAVSDIMISMANSYELVGKVAIVREVPERATFGAFLAAIRPVLIEPYFLLYVLRSPRMQAAFRSSSSQTTNIANISLARMRPLPFPLPPLGEQRRIVAKIDELMASCDQLEVQRRERQVRHVALARASLARFAEAPTSVNLDFLFHDSYEIAPGDLRKAIVSLALRGNLISPHRNEKYSGDLPGLSNEMSSIRGFYGNTNPPDGAANLDEAPYELPPHWAWYRIGSLRPVFQNGVSSRGDPAGMPVVVLRLADIVAGRISSEQNRTININRGDIPKYSLLKGDTLITRVNGSADIVGRFVSVDTDLEAIYCDHFIRMRIEPDVVDSRYLWVLGISPLVRNQIAALFITTAGQKTVNQGHIASLIVPIPPLREQRRIAAKVHRLLTLVDQLESQLSSSNAMAQHLMTAVVGALVEVPAPLATSTLPLRKSKVRSTTPLHAG